MVDNVRNTVLLTGATGFFGSHLLKNLLKCTNNNIVVLKRSFSKTHRIESELSSSRIVSYDIDKVSLEHIQWNDIFAVIHCATEYGRVGVPSSKILESNLIFPVNIAELAIKNGVNTFINTDSYFNKEGLSYQYLLDYSLSKKSLNLWLKYFSQKIKVVNMILEHIYGEDDNPDKFVEKMIQDIAIKPKPEINLSGGDQKRDFIYIKDVCDAYVGALNYSQKNNFRYKSFQIGTGKAISLKDFVSFIKQISNNNETKLNFGALPYRADEIMFSVADTCELYNIVNVDKFCSFKEGIKNVICYYRNKGK